MDKQTKTLQVRVKDRHAKLLERMAYECNQVWNMANEITDKQDVWLPPSEVQRDVLKYRQAQRFIILSHTAQEVVAKHGKARQQFKKSKLRWRVSFGPNRSLGWIPFKKTNAQWKNGQVRFAGHDFKVWDSYGLENYEFRAGSFSQDARGRWYFNVAIQYQEPKTTSQTAVGVDLGLKDYATCSDGERLQALQPYRTLEQKLGVAQRANNKVRVKSLHAKIKNQRKDNIHKFSTLLAKQHGAIFVGNVSSAKLAKTKMAKSVLDAGWYMLKTQLKYKAIARSVVFEEVNESYSTQTCSCCRINPKSSPRGSTGLRIRHWTCSECGAEHDRDINAAKNILAAGGHSRLDGGITPL